MKFDEKYLLIEKINVLNNNMKKYLLYQVNTRTFADKESMEKEMQICIKHEKAMRKNFSYKTKQYFKKFKLMEIK